MILQHCVLSEAGVLQIMLILNDGAKNNLKGRVSQSPALKSDIKYIFNDILGGLQNV